MTNADHKTTALIALRVKTDEDAIVEGNARAEFTLPKEEIENRGFAVQLYRETKTKHRHMFSFVGSYDKSKVDGQTLRFEFVVPKVQIKKGETWVFVLYGDDRTASPAPSPSASASASDVPAASPSPTATP